MNQASLLAFVKVKKTRKKEILAFRFLVDIPSILGPDLKTYGGFKKGDLVSEGALPKEIWRVLLERGAVEPHYVDLKERRGGKGA